MFRVVAGNLEFSVAAIFFSLHVPEIKITPLFFRITRFQPIGKSKCLGSLIPEYLLHKVAVIVTFLRPSSSVVIKNLWDILFSLTVQTRGSYNNIWEGVIRSRVLFLTTSF